MRRSQFSIGERTRAPKLSRHVTTTIALAALFTIPLSACTRHERGPDAGRYPSAIERLAVRRERPDPAAEAESRGQKVYEHYCQICHGPEAQGNGFNAAMLDPPPRNFADETFWQQADDEHLRKVIGQGGQAAGKSKLMPAWGKTLAKQQIGDVIAYLRTVPEQAKQHETAADSTGQ